MQIYLGGHLSWYDRQKRSKFEIRLNQPALLLSIVQRLGVPEGEIAIAAVNGSLVPLADARVVDSDRVELFPPVGGGSHPVGDILSELDLLPLPDLFGDRLVPEVK